MFLNDCFAEQINRSPILPFMLLIDDFESFKSKLFNRCSILFIFNWSRLCIKLVSCVRVNAHLKIRGQGHIYQSGLLNGYSWQLSMYNQLLISYEK